MKGMNRGLKVLKAQVADPAKKEESLRAINEMQRSCVAAKGQPLPKNILEKSGDGKNLLEKTGHEKSQAQLTAAYRKHMIAALRLMLDIEEAITADNTTVAQTKLAELEKLRDSSHDELGVKDE